MEKHSNSNFFQAETCRSFFKAHKARSSLPPKIKESKALIQGSLALKIKRMVQDKPSISYRDIEMRLGKVQVKMITCLDGPLLEVSFIILGTKW